MRTPLRLFSMLLSVNLAAPLLAETSFEVMRADIERLGNLTASPVMTPADGFESKKNIRAIFFDGLNWQGKPSKVFAWLGLPENAKEKVPGVVLVHGGGGTAFKEWVEIWTSRGYAAISIAVEGQTDRQIPGTPLGAQWERHAEGGPSRLGIYGDASQDIKNQWMYHATADAILANSLLRSLPEVQADKVGIMGISWGGVIAATAIGIDNRFAFAIPVYGCGGLDHSLNQYGQALGNNKVYLNAWDPNLRLERAGMPTLWFSWPEDTHFPMDCLACSHEKQAHASSQLALVPTMGHGHGPPWKRLESYAFADSIVKEGRPWILQTASTLQSGKFQVTFDSMKPLDAASLISTTGTGFTGNRTWVETPATLNRSGDSWIASADIPVGTRAFFLNVKSGNLTATSDYKEAP